MTQKIKNSEAYWENRYRNGSTSGAGSYNHLGEFKAKIINRIMDDYNIKSIVELGSGDGNQLSLFDLDDRRYVGLDVSKTIIQKCKENDNFIGIEFYKIPPTDITSVFSERMDLSMSLDVLYHLIEDDIYEHYLDSLFALSHGYVLIYAFPFDTDIFGAHIKPRDFRKRIASDYTDWIQIEHIPNEYPAINDEASKASFSEFFLYKRM